MPRTGSSRLLHGCEESTGLGPGQRVPVEGDEEVPGGEAGGRRAGALGHVEQPIPGIQPDGVVAARPLDHRAQQRELAGGGAVGAAVASRDLGAPHDAAVAPGDEKADLAAGHLAVPGLAELLRGPDPRLGQLEEDVAGPEVRRTRKGPGGDGLHDHAAAQPQGLANLVGERNHVHRPAGRARGEPLDHRAGGLGGEHLDPARPPEGDAGEAAVEIHHRGHVERGRKGNRDLEPLGPRQGRGHQVARGDLEAAVAVDGDRPQPGAGVQGVGGGQSRRADVLGEAEQGEAQLPVHRHQLPLGRLTGRGGHRVRRGEGADGVPRAHPDPGKLRLPQGHQEVVRALAQLKPVVREVGEGDLLQGRAVRCRGRRGAGRRGGLGRVGRRVPGEEAVGQDDRDQDDHHDRKEKATLAERLDQGGSREQRGHRPMISHGV